MPDLLAHVAAGYVVAARYRSRAWMALFLIGTILPDFLTRSIYILLPVGYWFVKPLHTPLGIICYSVLFSGLFAAQDRRMVFTALLSGGFLHVLLDLIQRHLHGGYPLLFPFSWQTFEFGLLWPEQTLLLTPFLVAGMLIVIWRKRAKQE